MKKTQKHSINFIVYFIISLILLSAVIIYTKNVVLENTAISVAKNFKGELFSEGILELPEGEIVDLNFSDDGDQSLILLKDSNRRQNLFLKGSSGYEQISQEGLEFSSNIAFGNNIFFVIASEGSGNLKLYCWERGIGITQVGDFEFSGQWNLKLSKSKTDLIIYAKENNTSIKINGQIANTNLLHLHLLGHLEDSKFTSSGLRKPEQKFEIVKTPQQIKITELEMNDSLYSIIEKTNKKVSIKKQRLRDRIKLDFNADQREDILTFENSSQLPLWSGYTFDGYNSSTKEVTAREAIMMNWRVGDGKGVPIVGDYNGDGVLDLATFTPGNGFNNTDTKGQWQIYYSMPHSLRDSTIDPTKGYVTYQLGTDTALPVPADYDGDGITDLAVYDPKNHQWQIVFSSTGNNMAKALAGYQESGLNIFFGEDHSIPVKGDVDGDGADDIILYQEAKDDHHNSNWNILLSSAKFDQAQKKRQFVFGKKGDYPFTADYNGDGKNELVTFSSQTCTFSIRYSSTEIVDVKWNNCYHQTFGYSQDFDGDGKADFILSTFGTEAKWHIYTSNLKIDAYGKFPNGWNMMTTISWGNKEAKSIQQKLYQFYLANSLN